MKKITTSIKYLQVKRFNRLNKINDKLLKKKNKEKKYKTNRKINLKVRKEHIDAYQKISNENVKIRKRQHKYELVIPKVFALYEAPENVLLVIKKVADLANEGSINEIFIDHSKCEKHDLAAETLLTNAVRSLNAIKTKGGARFKIAGTLPGDQKMKRLLRSIGVVRESAAKTFQLRNVENLKLYKRISNPLESKVELGSTDKKTAATAGFVPYLNECLYLIKAKLDTEEESQLNQYLGEVLGNAEDHSGKKLWTLVGYLDAQDSNNLYCEIVIMNIGKTILDSFEEKRGVPIVNDKWQNYITRHIDQLSEEQLTMVYSLQQNASSKLDESITRGQGTKYLINLFHHLTDECNRINGCQSATSSICNPKMLILSGGAMLKFDGTYKPSLDHKGRMVYALNDVNRLDVAPDECYSPALRREVTFPGTAIYIRFSLRASDLVKNEDG